MRLRKFEFSKSGFDGLQCSHCGEMIPADSASQGKETVRCPICGWVTSTARQTIRVPSDRELLAHPPSLVVDEGSVDGVHRVFIRRRPFGRSNVVSFFCWLFGTLAVEAALVFGFGIRSGTGPFYAAPQSVRLAALAALGLAFLFVYFSSMLLVFRTRGWRIALSADAVRIRVYVFGVLPWIRATVISKSSFLFADCVWYGGVQGRTPYRDFSPKNRPKNSVLHADDGNKSMPILTTDDFEIVLYVRALLNAWRGAVMEFPRPDKLSEEGNELVYRPGFVLGQLGGWVLLALFWTSALVERLLETRIPLAVLTVLFGLAISAVHKACVYRFRVSGNDLVCTFRCLGLVRVWRCERKDAVASLAKWLGFPSVFVRTGNGQSRRLVGDVPDRIGNWIVYWLKERLSEPMGSAATLKLEII